MACLKFIFSGFWIFVGSVIILSMILHTLLLFWNRFLRSVNIRKHGWPPAHCDADGDFLKSEKEPNNS